MTTKRPLRFGLLKGRVQIPADFDRPMSLAEFFGLAESTVQSSSGAPHDCLGTDEPGHPDNEVKEKRGGE